MWSGLVTHQLAVGFDSSQPKTKFCLWSQHTAVSKKNITKLLYSHSNISSSKIRQKWIKLFNQLVSLVLFITCTYNKIRSAQQRENTYNANPSTSRRKTQEYVLSDSISFRFWHVCSRPISTHQLQHHCGSYCVSVRLWK